MRLNHVTLIISNLDASLRFYERLGRDGLRFEQPPTDMSCLWREARLRDPDGHQIRLYDAGVNRLDPPWRIDRK